MQIKNFTTGKLMVYVVALQILNMSIDMPASSKDYTAKDYNFIDTYVEYIAEVMFRYENAIPESRHMPHKQFQVHQHLPMICHMVKNIRLALPVKVTEKKYGFYSDRFAYQFIKEINPPPPRLG